MSATRRLTQDGETSVWFRFVETAALSVLLSSLFNVQAGFGHAERQGASGRGRGKSDLHLARVRKNRNTPVKQRSACSAGKQRETQNVAFCRAQKASEQFNSDCSQRTQESPSFTTRTFTTIETPTTNSCAIEGKSVISRFKYLISVFEEVYRKKGIPKEVCLISSVRRISEELIPTEF